MANLTMAEISGYQNWYSQSMEEWGMIRVGKEEKLEAIQQPESFILTCQYCGTTTRVKDDFSCPACGAPFDMKFVGALPNMVITQYNPSLMSKAEARRRWLGIPTWHV